MGEVIEYPAPDLSQCVLPEPPYERERRAFRELFPTRLETHFGQCVAIHGAKGVTSGNDEIAVALEEYSRVGYVPLFVGLVSDKPRSLARISSPRIWRAPGASAR